MTINVRRRRDRKLVRRVRKVLLNGQDVTTRCFYVDPRRGVVRLYRLRDGKKFVEPILNAPHWDVPRRVATEEIRGRVQVNLA